jgi:arylformamidase
VQITARRPAQLWANLKPESETMTEVLYRGMDRVAIDSAYNNVLADPIYKQRMAGFQELSDALYRSVPNTRDIAYGARPRQRFDWLAVGQASAPTFVFIHGGYWQNYTKEGLAFVARGALERGFNVVLAEYTLAPEATMTEIAKEVGMLLDFLRESTGEIGFGGRPVCLCGHSAGGQLATLHRGHPSVSVTVAMSALFDLEPIALSWLNEKLKLTPEEIALYSPIRDVTTGSHLIISVGEAELPELIRQSHDYSAACKESGKSVHVLGILNGTHFSVLEDLADPNGMHLSAITSVLV